MPTTDLCGKPPQLWTVTDHQKKLVCEHIMSLPTVTSHYTRAKSPHRCYLTSDLSIEDLHNMYLLCLGKEHPADGNKSQYNFFLIANLIWCKRIFKLNIEKKMKKYSLVPKLSILKVARLYLRYSPFSVSGAWHTMFQGPHFVGSLYTARPFLCKLISLTSYV